MARDVPTKMRPERNLRLEWLTADQLDDNPMNWKFHPDAQKAGLTQSLSSVGWAGALLYNERTHRLVDGHARKGLRPGEPMPVLVGSWTEEQERLILATLDPLGAMAEDDPAAMRDLLASIDADALGLASDPEDDSLAQLLEQLADRAAAGLVAGLASAAADDDGAGRAAAGGGIGEGLRQFTAMLDEEGDRVVRSAIRRAKGALGGEATTPQALAEMARHYLATVNP